LNEWIVDNGLTPYLLVDAEYPGTIVPMEFLQDGKIVLNISNTAVTDLKLGNDAISCNARFSGNSMELFVPVGAVAAIYAKENGMGLLFPEEDDSGSDPEMSHSEDHKKPDLKVVK
jgi:stringent starvation protein B